MKKSVMNYSLSMTTYKTGTAKFDPEFNQDYASKIPLVVIKRLLQRAERAHINRFRNLATLDIGFSFLGVKKHHRRIIFLRTELVDPFTWNVEDPKDFINELLAEKELLEKVA